MLTPLLEVEVRRVARTAAIAVLTLIAAVALAVTTTMTSIALAATALIMGGTGHPLSLDRDTTQFVRNYVGGAASNYILPAEKNPPTGPLCTSPCTLVAVVTPEQFRFDTGLFDMTFDQSVAEGQKNLHRCISGAACTVTGPPFPDPNSYTSTTSQTVSDTTYVVYGYSQSATVATIEKRNLIENGLPPGVNNVSFILAANPNRPNGGILERFKGLHIPILGVTFNGATPTDSDPSNPLGTIDIARQYDGWADFPTNPLNLLADLNAAMGIYYLHGNYYGVGTPQQQGQYGDTTYYLIPTPVLPLLMPVDKIPLIGHALAVTADPFLRVLVEAGYNRTINPGEPTTAQWLYFPNPISTLVNLVVAIPTGLDNLISTIVGNPDVRPFGTTAPGPYGVGGPAVNTGCGGSGPCTGPTLSNATTLIAMTSFAEGKLAAEQGADPKLTKDDKDEPTFDTSLTESPKTGTEQLTADTGNQQVTSGNSAFKTDSTVQNVEPSPADPKTERTTEPTTDPKAELKTEPKPELKPKPKLKPFSINLNLPGLGPNEPKVRKPLQGKPPASDPVPAPGSVPEKPTDPKPAGSDPTPQGNTSEPGTPAGATSAQN